MVVDKNKKEEKTLKDIKDSIKVIKDNKDLEKQEFFHGFRPRKDVLKLVRDPGDFLVRVTDGQAGSNDFVITVMGEKKNLINLTLKFENDLWQLSVLKQNKKKAVPGFKSVVDLVSHYKEHPLPGKIKLKKVIARPEWLIKPDKITYDKDKDLLGFGNFCNVYKGTYHASDGTKTVAIKICHEASGKQFEESREARNAMIQEAQLMSYYCHEYVIRFFGVACDRPPVLIVMEYCPGGNLGVHLSKHGDNIEVGERLMYSLEAARGMCYLHRMQCIHRDLAARNCLISSSGSVKIADFGMSQLVQDLESKPGEEVSTTEEISPQIPLRWMAPESLKKPRRYSTKSDVWSYGVLLYEIFNNGSKPWAEETNHKKMATNIRKGNMPAMPEKAPQEVKALVGTIWQVEPEKRPEMKKICSQLNVMISTYKPPPEEKFTLNSIPGVCRQNACTDETADESETHNKNTSLDGQTVTMPAKDNDEKSAAPRRKVAVRRSTSIAPSKK